MGTDHGNIKLNDVVVVPSFKVNLMSVVKMLDKGATVIYEKDKATVVHGGKVRVDGGEVAFTVPRQGNLFVLTSNINTQQ